MDKINLINHFNLSSELSSCVTEVTDPLSLEELIYCVYSCLLKSYFTSKERMREIAQPAKSTASAMKAFSEAKREIITPYKYKNKTYLSSPIELGNHNHNSI